MMSTFTVSDYMKESPNYDQEYIKLQNELLKNQQLQNRQYGRDQLTLSQFNYVYNVSPQQYTISDQYRRNKPILNSKPNQNETSLKVNNHNKSLMLSAKKLIKGRNVNNNVNQNSNMNRKESDSKVNPLYLMNNQNNPQVKAIINQNQSQNQNNKKLSDYYLNNMNKDYSKDVISPKVKVKKHKYLNQYHDFNLATRQGWLHVKYGTFKIWKKRWAILVYDTLYLLKDQYINNEKPPKIVLVLQLTANNHIDSDKQESKKFTFKIKDPKLNTLHFAADTQLSMITWVNLFVRIITSNPIKQIQLYPLKEQNIINDNDNSNNDNQLIMDSNINSVEIGDHFKINRNEKYHVIQKHKELQPISNINNDINMNVNNSIPEIHNNGNIGEYNIRNLREINANQEQFNGFNYNLYNNNNNNNNNSNNNNNNNLYANLPYPSMNNNPMLSQQTQMIQQHLQQQYENILKQQQQQQQQQQQYHQINKKKRNTDHKNLTIDTNFDRNGTITKSKLKTQGINNSHLMYNGNRPLNIDTSLLSGEKTLLSGETTSAMNTIFNDMYVSPGNLSHININLNSGNDNNNNNGNNNNLSIPMNYTTNYSDYPRKPIYTPVSYSNETSQIYYNSPYGQNGNNYKYVTSTTEQNQNVDPYGEIPKYNNLSNIPRSAQTINESFLNNTYQNILNETDNYNPQSILQK